MTCFESNNYFVDLTPPHPKIILLLLLLKNVIVFEKNFITIGLIKQKNMNENKKTLLTSWN